MANLINKFNAEIEQQIMKDIEQKAEREKKSKIEVYKECFEKKLPLDIVFDSADSEGNLSMIDEGGITFVLLADTFQANASYYVPQIKDKFIGINLNVRIQKIDDEKNVIYVESTHNRYSLQKQINGEIRRELEKGNHPYVIGRIISVNDKYAIVDIFGKGVQGIIFASHWSKGWTRFLKEVCNKNEFYQFEVKREKPRKKDQRYNQAQWELTRENIAPDPWDGFENWHVNVDSVMQVKIVEKPDQKSYCWGTSKRTPGIEIMVNKNDNLNLLVGTTYKCRVKDINTEKHMFKVSPFEAVASGLTSSVVIKNLTERKKRADNADTKEENK